MVEAARKYDRVVQVGAQTRSGPYAQEAIQYIREGNIGDIHYARVWNCKQRSDIGKKPNTPAPDGVDYDMWLGPAKMREFNENHFHYAWHWFWEYSGGDIINDGVHQIDFLRWCLDRDYPKSVYSTGGIYFFDDDQETPDTHIVCWDYDGLSVVFEQTLWAPYMIKTPWDDRDKDILPYWPFNGTRIELSGTKQRMHLSRHGGGWEAFDENGKSIKVCHGRHPHEPHFDNFLECMRTRKRPNSDIEELHKSTLLCHYGNIAYRTGRKLQIDPTTEAFVDDDEANSYVKRDYRAPWAVPEVV
jgi:predicted dehydrogenase